MTRLLLIPLLALSACATVPAQPRHEGPAALSQATYVDGPVVTPLALLEDSRCPMNARCVWAGRVVLKVRIATGGGVGERDLTLGEPVQVADGTLSLTSVTPERMTGTRIEPRQYRFGFEFQGGL
jgi:hypothetical protein